MRNKLRYYWLTFKRDFKKAWTQCVVCKKFGAYPCSIAGLLPLCDLCQLYESRRLDRTLKIARCIRPYPHVCKVNGPCNGLPR